MRGRTSSVSFCGALILMIALFSAACGDAQAASTVRVKSHAKVFYQPGRYGGWPANHGLWSWGNEILVGFTAGTYQDRGTSHHIDTDQPVRHMQARSLDGGQSWQIEDPNARGQLLPEGTAIHGKELPGIPLPPWEPSPSNIHFRHPGFAMTLRMSDNHIGPSKFFLSYNRGLDWQGPYRVPAMGQLEIAARTDYVVTADSEALLFLTAAKRNHREGRPFMARVSEHGARWEFVSWIADEPPGFLIMPSTLDLGRGELYTVIRHRNGPERSLKAYRSLDNGITWLSETAPAKHLGTGNPPSLVQLPDGRLCVTYGVRAEPFRICARLSGDRGRSWGPELIIRDDGSSSDLGYPRSVVRADGLLLTVYYFSDAGTGPERYIAASLWEPPAKP